jgi:hypothetical protein
MLQSYKQNLNDLSFAEISTGAFISIISIQQTIDSTTDFKTSILD